MKYLHNEYGRAYTHAQLYPLLGIKAGHHLPDEGVFTKFIGGVYVYVMGKQTAKERGITQRVRALCPHCDKDVNFGNLQQHLKVHKEPPVDADDNAELNWHR